MRGIGVHIRFDGSLLSAAEKAVRYQIPFFQCFLVSHKTGRLIRITEEDRQRFLIERQEYFGSLYAHGSYWINLAGMYHGHRALYREVELARKLEFTHIIVHPGSAGNVHNKQKGVEELARSINKFFAYESQILLVLENSAHGGVSIGGDIQDFKQLLTLLDKPERMLFCIDTAHAHSYGYDIVDAHARNQFIKLLESTIGFNAIALIHLNDTRELVGSKIDRHDVIGQGVIGVHALQQFVCDDRLIDIPLIMELPFMSEEEELKIINMVRDWHQNKG